MDIRRKDRKRLEEDPVAKRKDSIYLFSKHRDVSRKTLDALRQPVEDKKVSVARVNGAHTYPANFMFVTAMNPCPCGYYPSSKCRCTDYEIIKYRGKISGPIMDRIDIQKEVHPLKETSEKYGYSARVIHKLLRLARRSADLDGAEKIRFQDTKKVISCRDLDESNSKMMVVK